MRSLTPTTPIALIALTALLMLAAALPALADEAPAALDPVFSLDQPPVTTGAPALPASDLEPLADIVFAASACTQQCPGDPSRGIAPYTPNCQGSCAPRYENGQICGFCCNGYGLHCFPNGCTYSSC